MPIPVSCPNCNTNLKVPETAAGRKVRCPKCSTAFDVPAPPAADVADVVEVVDGSSVRPTAPPPLPARRPAPVPAYEDESYDQYDPPPRLRRQPPGGEGPGTGLQMGLGIASLAVGAGGLVIGLIPCIGFIPGLVGAGTGLVLGLVGLVVALTQKNRGIAFPIAGSATSAAGLALAFVWYALFYSATRAVDRGINVVGDLGKQAFQLQKELQKQAFEDMKRAKGGNPPPFVDARDKAAMERSARNLQKIALAFHRFQDKYGSLPRWKSDGKNGVGELSWRVALLPFLGEEQLYNEFKLNEEYNSPHNFKLMERMPDVYKPPTVAPPPGKTCYLVFTGPNAPFRDDAATKLPGSFTDGTSNTFLVVESDDLVSWTQPIDIRFDRKGPLPRFGQWFPDGFSAAFADGSTRFIRRGRYNDELLRNLIDPADGNPINFPD